MSVTKSFIGPGPPCWRPRAGWTPRRVAEYVPELASSAFGSATVRQLMDMTTGIRFSEDYADPKAEVWASSDGKFFGNTSTTLRASSAVGQVPKHTFVHGICAHCHFPARAALAPSAQQPGRR